MSWDNKKKTATAKFLKRADEAAGGLNVVLFVFVVGLAALDFTLLVTQKVVENLPPGCH